MASESDRPDHDDEVLEAGARTSRLSARWAVVRAAHPRAVRALLVGLTVLAATVAVVSGVTDHRGPTHPARPSSSGRADRPPRAPTARTLALREVRELTEHTGPLRDYVRQTSAAGACAQVRPGRSPVPAIEMVLSRAVPAFRVADVSRTLDQFTDLCALQLRATGPDGSVLGLIVISPVAGSRATPYLRTGQGAGPPDTSFVQLRDRDGWTVLVGTASRRGRPAGRNALRHIAADPKLTW